MDKLELIAKRAGVSPNTVLRVLRGENKEVWPSAIRRAEEIRGLARELAYLPNGSARAMRRGRFDCVALVLSTDQGRSYLPDDLFNSIHDALAEQGIRLVISKLPDAQLTSCDVLPSILREMSCDGLLINYTDRVPQAMVELIEQYRIPSIWLNCRQPADCIYYDDLGGARAATEHLINLGHQRIAYIDFVASESQPRAHYSRFDRYEGYAQAMQAAGLDVISRERFAGIPTPQRLDALLALLASPGRPTALISYDTGDRMLYAAALAGLRVPDDVSLLSFSVKHAPPTPEVTSETFIGKSVGVMHLPTEKAGRQAVEMLLAKIADPESDLPPRAIPLELEPGDTCAAAPQEPGRYGNTSGSTPLSPESATVTITS